MRARDGHEVVDLGVARPALRDAEENPDQVVAAGCLGRRVKIRYMTEAKARPPFFVLFGNSVDKIPESSRRLLVNGLRETFGLVGVLIRLSMRSGGSKGRKASVEPSADAVRRRFFPS